MKSAALGHASQHSEVSHFGLADNTTVDSLIVTWPGGAVNHYTQIAADQTISISEDGTLTSTVDPIMRKPLLEVLAFPNPSSGHVTIQFYLPDAGVAELHGYNALGHCIGTINKTWYGAGTHSVVMEGFEWAPSGWYLIQIKSHAEVAMCDVVRP